MTLSRTNIFLAVILALVALSSAMVRVDFSRPNFEVALGKDMTYSPAYDTYAPNSNFANGRTLQVPVPGTIARGELPLHYEATPESALLAGEQLFDTRDLSIEDHGASVRRGAAAFGVFCVACHGGEGLGDGPVKQRGFPPPPSLLAGKSVAMKDGQLFHILTYGQGSMPAFAAELSPDQRWDVVNHLRDLQQQAAPPDQPATDGRETPKAADADVGEDEKAVAPADGDEKDTSSQEKRPALPGDDPAGEPVKEPETDPATKNEPGANGEADVPPSTESSDAEPTPAEPRKAEQTETPNDTDSQP